MRVRATVEADLTDVARLLQTSFEQRLRPYMTYAQAGIGAFLGDRLVDAGQQGNRTHLTCVDDGGRVVGYAEFAATEPTAHFLSYICVDAGMQRRGVATALIEHFLAVTEELARLDLEVLDHNAPALSMYQRMGFTTTGPGNRWCVRPLPAPVEPPVGGLEILPVPPGSRPHSTYGFGELHVAWLGREVRLGRLGSHVLRCFDGEAFADDALLAAVRTSYPSLDEAFLVQSDHQVLPESARIVAQTTRMTLAVDAAQAPSGGAP